MESEKKRFDYLNFAYGIGAAIVITGAMAKFLGWEFANQLFLFGLSAEAIVFTISAFEYKQIEKTETDSKWEQLFPELVSGTGGPANIEDQITKENATTSDSVSQTFHQLNEVIKNLNAATGQLTKSIENINNNLVKTETGSKKFDLEFGELQGNISKLNEFYSDLLIVAGRKEQRSA